MAGSRFEVVAALSVASDAGHGVPLGHQLRTAVLALRAGERLQLGDADLRDCFDATLLRWVGCTATAPVLSAWFGDEVGAHVRALRFETPVDPLLEILRHAGADRPAWQRLQTIVGALRAGPGAVFGAACEVGEALAARLGYPDTVLAALAATFERWDGHGWPGELRGDAIPIAARVAAVADDAQTYAEGGGTRAAIEVVNRRRARHHDPAYANAVLAVLRDWEHMQHDDAWRAAAEAQPGGIRRLAADELDAALEAVADLKTPVTSGHSRAVAALADAAAESLAVAPADRALVRRAGLVHELGRLTVSNAIWQKPGRLSHSALEQIRLCPYWTERYFATAESLADVGALASACRERLDGSGYHRGIQGSAITTGARILAAADVYQALVEPRLHRPAFSPDAAADVLRGDVRGGLLDGDAVDAVLTAAGHRARRRRPRPAGLTAREAEVLRLLATGLTNKQIAQRLVVSHRTVRAPRRGDLPQGRRQQPRRSHALRHPARLRRASRRTIGRTTDAPNAGRPYRRRMTNTATPLTTTDAQRLCDTHTAAWNAGDAAGMAAAYERDGRLLDPFGRLADGAEEIAARFAEIHQTVMRGATTTCSVESVRAISEDLAVADGTQIIDGATAPDGARLPELALHFTAILRRTDGDLGILECRPYAFLPAG